VELYIVRHAIAHERDAARWPDDSLRPLTPEGEERFRRAARGLARLVPTVEVVLSSGFVRAWRTAEILNEEAGWPAPQPCEELEADRNPEEAVGVLSGLLGRARVAMVGHEPHLSELTALLLTGRRDGFAQDLKKGGAIRLDVFGPPWESSSVLLWTVPPKALRWVAR
jgi:phosphohistidine phosphatase